MDLVSLSIGGNGILQPNISKLRHVATKFGMTVKGGNEQLSEVQIYDT